MDNELVLAGVDVNGMVNVRELGFKFQLLPFLYHKEINDELQSSINHRRRADDWLIL